MHPPGQFIFVTKMDQPDVSLFSAIILKWIDQMYLLFSVISPRQFGERVSLFYLGVTCHFQHVTNEASVIMKINSYNLKTHLCS